MRKLAATIAVVAFGLGAASAQAAITISRAELSSGQLRVEGSGALPNHAVTVNPGAVPGSSDGSGAFRVQTSPYSSSTCQVTVSDGTSTSASTKLSGCTASTPAPSPSPSPTPTPTPTPSPSAPAVTLTPSSLTYATRDTGTTSPSQSASLHRSAMSQRHPISGSHATAGS